MANDMYRSPDRWERELRTSFRSITLEKVGQEFIEENAEQLLAN